MVRQRKAFTTIELLVAIGIIVVLIGMLLIGSKVINASANKRGTDVSLSNARAMMGELEAIAKGLTRQPDQIWVNGAATPTSPALDAWKTKVKSPLGVGSGQPDRITSDAARNTGIMFQLITTAPLARDSATRLPPERVHLALSGFVGGTANPNTRVWAKSAGPMQFYETPVATTTPPPSAPWTETFSSLTDGWGNPIIFVPAGGIYDVLVAGQNRDINNPVKSPDGRPFFASAGPDGDFHTGDDNVYSFEQ